MADNPIVWLVHTILWLMSAFIILSAVLSWLIAFDVINPRNRLVYLVLSFLDSVTRPLLEPFRRIIPNLGGVDISPLVVLLLIGFVRRAFDVYAAPALESLMG